MVAVRTKTLSRPSCNEAEERICIRLRFQPLEVNPGCIGPTRVKPGREERLIRATRYGHLDTVDTLLNALMDPNHADHAGWTALRSAVHTVVRPSVRLAAVEEAAYLIIEKLLAAGAYIDLPCKEGWTPLHEATHYGDTAMVDFLLRAGANPCAEHHKRRSILSTAARKGFWAIAKMLVEYGADVDTPGKHGWTLLLYAARDGDWDMCEWCLSNGASASTSTKHGWTALHAAALDGHTEVVKGLLECDGVAFNAVDRRSWTPVALATKRGHEEVLRLLLTRSTPTQV